MKKLLLRLFVKNHTDTRNPAVRTQYGKLAGITGIFCNLLLFAGKLVVGTLCKSVSITADAVNNLSDASSSVVTLLGDEQMGIIVTKPEVIENAAMKIFEEMEREPK